MRTRLQRLLRRCAALAGALLALLVGVGAGSPAAASVAEGTTLSPVKDRYEPGEMVKMVGYVSPAPGGGWLADGPFFARLHVDLDLVPLGAITTQPLAPPLATVRAVAEFRVPSELAPGRYDLSFCNEPCRTTLGDLWGATLDVSMDPAEPIVRTWLADDPEVANLPPGALLTRPSLSIPRPPPTAAPPTAAPPTAAPPTAAPPGTAVATSPLAPMAASTGGVSTVALVVGGAIALTCVGLVLAALRDS